MGRRVVAGQGVVRVRAGDERDGIGGAVVCPTDGQRGSGSQLGRSGRGIPLRPWAASCEGLVVPFQFRMHHENGAWSAACGKCGVEQLVRRHSLSACVLGVPQRADGEVDLPAQAGCCDGCCFPKVKSAAADRHGDAACPVVLCPDKLKFHLILKQFPVAVRWPLATRDEKWVSFSSLRAGLAWSAITSV